MPSGVVKTGLAVLLPITIGQLARDGYVTAESEASGERQQSWTAWPMRFAKPCSRIDFKGRPCELQQHSLSGRVSW